MATIRDLREKRGMTQRDLAKILGVKTQLISNIERNLTSLPAKHFNTLAKVFGKNPEWFLKQSIKTYEARLRQKMT